MKIKSMTATFGRLNGETLVLQDGLNLIHGPNEAGKSTWCAFWKAMLYGIDTRERDRAGHLADKNRCQPWSGAPMEGELKLEWKGRDITLRRGPRGTAAFGAFSATYTGTGEPVPFLTAQNCGETLTGVSREVFERSAFIGGGELAVTSTPDLEKRIAALVSSGQEDVSFSQVEARLKEWMNRRKVNRSVGQIPRLEEELSQAGEELSRMEGLTGRIAALEGEYASLTAQTGTWTEELELHRRLARQELDARFTQAQADLDRAEAQLHRLEQESARFGALPDRETLKRAQGELQYLKVLDDEIQEAKDALNQAEEDYVTAQRSAQDSRFAGMTPDEAARRGRDDLAQYRELMERARQEALGAGLLPLAGVLLGGGWLALRFLLAKTLLPLDLIPAAVLLALGAGLGLIARRRVGLRRQQAEKLLTRWSASTPEALEQQISDYRRRCGSTELAAAELKHIRGALNDKLARKENTLNGLMNFVHSFAPEVTALFGCSAALSRALNLDFDLAAARERVEQYALRRDDLAAQGAAPGEENQPLSVPAHTPEECRAALDRLNHRSREVKAALDQARGALSSLGDPAAAAARREELEEELSRREGEYRALELALNTMREAYAGLQTRFSPALNRLAGEYLSRLTGEKYASLVLDRQLGGEATRTGELFSRSSLYLSRGTLDQLYLSVRLAVCSLCLPERPPIVLDDALTAFDDTRMQLALNLLLELAGDQQLLVFTCQDREGKALAGKPVNRLELP